MRIRSLKPEFWTSRTVSRLPHAARLTFAGLWTYADDEGRAVDDARLVKAAVWPLDDDVSHESIEGHLQLLADLGLIIRYTAVTKPLLAITNWVEHQRISKPTPSKFPAPPKEPRETPEVSRNEDHPQESVDGEPQGNPGLARARRNREQGKEQGLSEGREESSSGESPEPSAQELVGLFVDEYRAAHDGHDPTRSMTGQVAAWTKRTLNDRKPAATISRVLGAAGSRGRFSPGWLDGFLSEVEAGRDPRNPASGRDPLDGVRALAERVAWEDPR